MKIKHLLALCLFSTLSFSLFAQDEEEPKKGFDRGRLFIGGNFGLSFGSFTMINISPQVGYRFNNYLAAGAGVNFNYSSTNYDDPSYIDKIEYGVAGLNIFGRVYPFPYGFIQLQPELNYVWGKEKYNDGTPDIKIDGSMIPSLLAGAGAAIPAGRGAFTITAQYDLLHNSNIHSPYGSNVFFSFGFIAGL